FGSTPGRSVLTTYCSWSSRISTAEIQYGWFIACPSVGCVADGSKMGTHARISSPPNTQKPEENQALCSTLTALHKSLTQKGKCQAKNTLTGVGCAPTV